MARPKSESKSGLWSAKDTAEFLGITTRWLLDLANQGVIKKEGRGQYPMPDAVQAFIKWQVETNARQAETSTADRLRERRDQEIAQRMAERDRRLISLDEALGAVDAHAGEYLASISGLPARITRNPRERQRIEAICDEERLRLTDRFAEKSRTLRTGVSASEADDEDDP